MVMVAAYILRAWRHVAHFRLSPFIALCLTFHLSLFAFHLFAAPLVVKDDYRSPRNKERRLRAATRLIVLHTTEAHAKSSLNKLSERGEAHYCVVENGTVYRIIDRDREAFHAGRSMWNGKEDCDTYSIGIEVVGHHDQAVTLQQLEALRQLLIKLKALYRLNDAQVVCHSHVAYGAPNTWHKKKHRGRKRCGMIFAMPSVRAKLGLAARPATDPDVKAKRLVQADSYLSSVLYGSVDTMAAQYGRKQTSIVAVAKPKPAASQGAAAGSGKSTVPPKVAAAGSGKSAAPPKVAASSPQKPPPVVKPPLIVPAEKPEQPKTEESSGGILSMIVPPVFKKKAKLVVPKKANGDVEQSPPASTHADNPSPVLELPKNLQIGRMGDTARDLKSLEALPGYVKGGPVTHDLTPYKIAGSAWKSPDTYYYTRGKITPGSKIDEKSIEIGTLIFYRSKATP